MEITINGTPQEIAYFVMLYRQAETNPLQTKFMTVPTCKVTPEQVERMTKEIDRIKRSNERKKGKV